MRAIIVGGGIAGPAMAMALDAVGCEAVILERSSGARAAGSWFTISPNGLAALEAVGSLEAVRALGVPTRRNIMRGATGRELGRLSLGEPLEGGTPALSFRRPDLSAALMTEAGSRGIDVRRGAAAVAVESTEAGAAVTLADGSRVAGDIVIGADGIRSIVRAAIDPDSPHGRYVGLRNFGGFTPGAAAAAGLEPEAWTFVFGRHAFFGALPTPDGDAVWFVNEPCAAPNSDERESRSAGDWLEHLEALTDGDAGPFADLIAHGTLDLAADPTHDLPKVQTWHRGNLAIIGDALHAPSPSSGQGASMALEDAVVMASCLKNAQARSQSPAVAFASFEAARRTRVERIVADGARSSRAKTAGPVARVFQDAMLRLVFRHVVTPKSTAFMYDYRVAL